MAIVVAEATTTKVVGNCSGWGSVVLVGCSEGEDDGLGVVDGDGVGLVTDEGVGDCGGDQ